MSFLDPIFNPLLIMQPLWIVIIISFLIALIITLIYRYTTDQNLMKQLKEETKQLQKEMKELRDQPEKMMEVQKKAMQTNMKAMMHSMRSTIFTFIPIILIFGWMNDHIAYEPILPGQDFSTTLNFEKGAVGNVTIAAPEGMKVSGDSTKEIKDSQVKWVLNGDKGEHLIEYMYNGQKFNKDVKISEEQEYAPVLKKVKGSMLKTISIDNKKLNVIWSLSWIWAYIIFSIVFSMIMRKLFKVY